jgi:hypothetical protein
MAGCARGCERGVFGRPIRRAANTAGEPPASHVFDFGEARLTPVWMKSRGVHRPRPASRLQDQRWVDSNRIIHQINIARQKS